MRRQIRTLTRNKYCFPCLSSVFNALGTYLGTRNLIYAWHAHDWSTIWLEVFLLPMGVIIGVYFLRKML